MINCPGCNASTSEKSERCGNCGAIVLNIYCPECEIVKSRKIIEYRRNIDEVTRKITSVNISKFDENALERERSRCKQQLEFMLSSASNNYPEGVAKCPICEAPLKRRF